MDEHIEQLRLLARLKLQVRRELDQAVDLERMKREPQYALSRLAEIEESAADEELLVTVLRLREMLDLYPADPVPTAPPAVGQRYLFGARS